MNKVEYSVRLRKIKDGEKGQSSFKSIVFRRGASVTAPSGGSFASPVPSGWSDGIPSENGQPCWMSSRVFTSDGQPPQSASWSPPQKVADTADFDVCFSSQASRPSAPTTHGTQNDAVWHETGTEDDIWMATSRCSNGTWSDWTISRIKGEDAVTYSLVPTPSSVRRSKDGSLSASSVSVAAYKTTGQNTEAVTDELVEFSHTQGGAASDWAAYVSPITLTAESDCVSFRLRESSSATDILAACDVQVLTDGQDGVGSYALDLSNENISIGLTSPGDGNLYPASGYNTGESGIFVIGGSGTSAILTKVEVYASGGASPIFTSTSESDTTYNNPDSLSGITQVKLSLSRIYIKVSTSTARVSGEKIELTIKGTISVTDSAGSRTVTAYKTLTLMFQPPGADGKSPTIYELKPANDTIVIGADGARRPSSTSCGVYMHSGDTTKDLTAQEIADAGLTVKYSAATSGAPSPPQEGAEIPSLSGITALTWYLYRGAAVYDQEAISFVKDGSDGTSPIVVDLDPDGVTIAVDASGAPLSGELPVSSTAHLYDGNTIDPAGVTWSATGTGCQASMSGNAISVTAVNAGVTSAYATIRAVYRSTTYTKTFSVSKAYPGPDGESPVVWSIEPSASAVHKDADGKITPSKLQCSVYRRVGGTRTQVDPDAEGSGCYLFYERNDSVGASTGKYPSDGVTIQPATKSVAFTLYETATMMTPLTPPETVFVVSDGADGEDGEDAFSTICDPQTVLTSADENVTNTVRITARLGSRQLPYGGSSYPYWEFRNDVNGTSSPGTIDSWIRWTFTNTSDAFSLKLLCFPGGSDRSSTLNCTVRLHKSSAEYTDYTLTIPVKTYRNGDPGPAGLVYRKTEWAEGVEYRNDKALLESGADASQSQNGDGVWYLDIVTKTGSDGKLIGVWECILTHTSQSAYDPESEEDQGTDTSEHWRKFSNWRGQPIYTSLILADGAVIGFMQGNQLKIFDSDGNLKAGISAASGSYPVLYANPQKYPVGVAVRCFANNTEGMAYPGDDSGLWQDACTLSQSAKCLHLQYIITWSDGTVTYNKSMNAYTYGGTSSVPVTPNPKFRATAEWGNLDIPVAQATGWSDTPRTSISKPCLCVKIGFSSLAYYIASQTAGGNPEHSQWQQYEDGSAQYGDPDGARVRLDAAPGSGRLPNIEIYDSAGNSAAVFDGTSYDTIDNIFGSGSGSESLATDDLVVNLQGDADGYATASRTATVTCTSTAILTVTTGSFKLYGSSESTTKGGNSINAVASVYVDGKLIAQGTLLIYDGHDIGYNDGYDFTSPRYSVQIPGGTHKLEVQLYAVRDPSNQAYAGSATLRIRSLMEISYESAVQRCRYFANGLIIGSTSSNYAVVWNNNGNMCFHVENSACGLRVTDDGVQIKRKGSTQFVAL